MILQLQAFLLGKRGDEVKPGPVYNAFGLFAPIAVRSYRGLLQRIGCGDPWPDLHTPITEDDEMYLKRKSDGHLVEVLSLNDLFAPTHPAVVGRLHYGEEIQDAEKFPKSDLSFPSGEDLPRCWLDVHYRDHAKR